MPVAGPSNPRRDAAVAGSVIDLTTSSPPLRSNIGSGGLALPRPRARVSFTAAAAAAPAPGPGPSTRASRRARAGAGAGAAAQNAGASDEVLVLSSGSEDEGAAGEDDEVQIVGGSAAGARAPAAMARPPLPERPQRLRSALRQPPGPPAGGPAAAAAAPRELRPMHAERRPVALPPTQRRPPLPPPPMPGGYHLGRGYGYGRPPLPPHQRNQQFDPYFDEYYDDGDFDLDEDDGEWDGRFDDVDLYEALAAMGAMGGYGPPPHGAGQHGRGHAGHGHLRGAAVAPFIRFLNAGDGPAPGLHGVIGGGANGGWGGAAAVKAAKKKYGVKMSHPRKVDKGFSRDITGDDDDVPLPTTSTTKSTRLGTAAEVKAVELEPVCASCLAPLSLAQTGPKRLWALKCGHVVCGGCLGEAKFRLESAKAKAAGVAVDTEDEKGKKVVVLVDSDEDEDDGAEQGEEVQPGRGRKRKTPTSSRASKKKHVHSDKAGNGLSALDIERDWTTCPVGNCDGLGTNLLAKEGDWMGAFELFV